MGLSGEGKLLLLFGIVSVRGPGEEEFGSFFSILFGGSSSRSCRCVYCCLVHPVHVPSLSLSNNKPLLFLSLYSV